MSLDRKIKDRIPAPISMKSAFHRKEQLDNWKNSPTARESAQFKLIPSVMFCNSTSFLAACAVGDIEDAERLLKNGADINSTNCDKLTALHQACIDCNLDVIEFLLSHGCNVNAQDVEGWTALHAAASCDYPEVVELLLEWDADVGIINNDNDLAVDLAEDGETSELLRRAAVTQGIDLDSARDSERILMMRDAIRWRSEGYPDDLPLDPFYNATPLHVAAAKGYVDVLGELLACRGVNVDAKDTEGWTPLHAAAHWGQKDAARMLCEAGSHIDTLTSTGLSVSDVTDPELTTYMRQLKEKFGVRLRKEAAGKLHEARASMIGRRSSVIRLSMDQKNLTRMQKEPSPMAMMFGNILLKKTLMGMMPREEIPDSTQSRVAEYRQKMLSMVEMKDANHDSSDCCLHSRNSSITSPTSMEANDHRLSLINEEGARQSLLVPPAERSTTEDSRSSQATQQEEIESPTGPILIESPTDAVFGETRRKVIAEDTRREPVVADTGRESIVGITRRKPIVGIAQRDSVGEDTQRDSIGKETRREPIVEDTQRDSAIEDTWRKSVVEETRREPIVEDTWRVSANEDTPRDTWRVSANEDTQRDSAMEDTWRKSVFEKTRKEPIVENMWRVSANEDTQRDSAIEDTWRKSVAEETRRKQLSEETERESVIKDTWKEPISEDMRREPTGRASAMEETRSSGSLQPQSVSSLPRVGHVHRAISKWSEVESGSNESNRPWVPLRRAKIVSDIVSTREQRSGMAVDGDSPRRKISSVLVPHKTDLTEAQRMARSRSALADRRSTQGEVFDSENDSVGDPFDEQVVSGVVSGHPVAEEADVRPAHCDYKALYEAALKECETLRDQVAQLVMEHDIQVKTIERQQQMQDLEKENAELRHDKALDDLRAENHRLKEENASLVRVISKMSKATL